jgi:hypothetical protein
MPTGSSTVFTETLSAVVIPAGIYYIAICSQHTDGADIITMWQTSDNQGLLNASVGSETVLQGTLTITAATIPSTIDPTAITGASNNSTVAFRFDN